MIVWGCIDLLVLIVLGKSCTWFLILLKKCPFLKIYIEANIGHILVICLYLSFELKCCLQGAERQVFFPCKYLFKLMLGEFSMDYPNQVLCSVVNFLSSIFYFVCLLICILYSHQLAFL